MNSESIPRSEAAKKAALATAIFTLAFAVELLRSGSKNSIAFGFFYGALLVHTYLSIRCFSSITPPDLRSQKVIDIALFILYLALVLEFGSSVGFLGAALLLFSVATLKYVLLLPHLPEYKTLIRKKIIYDVLGAILSIAALAGSLAGYEEESILLWVVIFILAMFYLVWIRPLYVIPDISREGFTKNSKEGKITKE